MAVETSESRQEVPSVEASRSRLIDGHRMTCPRCRVSQDILAFVPMGIVEEFRDELNPIYKCRLCRWIFSPALTIAELKLIFGISESEDSVD